MDGFFSWVAACDQFSYLITFNVSINNFIRLNPLDWQFQSLLSFSGLWNAVWTVINYQIYLHVQYIWFCGIVEQKKWKDKFAWA